MRKAVNIASFKRRVTEPIAIHDRSLNRTKRRPNDSNDNNQPQAFPGRSGGLGKYTYSPK